MMDDYLQELNFIDLISEKHKKLRKEVMKLWLEKHGEEITDTEAHMLAMLEKRNLTVAESARKVGVTRQAAHKCAKKLIEQGYIRMEDMEGNKRNKLLVLTEKGETYCDEMLKLKEKVEEEISMKIGRDNVEMIKKLLRKDWIDS